MQPAIQTLEIAPPRPEVELLPVSPGIARELMHPNRSAVVSNIQFSPDGKRIIGSDYPGGTIVLWDAESGQQVTEVQAESGGRGTSAYFHVSSDWSRVYVAEENDTQRKYQVIEEDGERKLDFTYGSYIRCWDLNTGEVIEDLQHDPPRSIRGMILMPDGERILSQYESLPGLLGNPGMSGHATLWNTATNEQTALRGGFGPVSVDGKLIGQKTDDDDGYTRELAILDAQTFEPQLTIATDPGPNWTYIWSIRNGGDLVLGTTRVFDKPADYVHYSAKLVAWGGKTGQELAVFEGEPDDMFLTHSESFSPAGDLCALTNWRSDERKLFVLRTDDLSVVHEVSLGTSLEGEWMFARAPVFTPDGKWIAVVTQDFSRWDAPVRIDNALDLPQPRIHLIDVASGKIAKTLTAPQGIPTGVTFSPDGKYLATGGLGRVQLWDMDVVLNGIEEGNGAD